MGMLRIEPGTAGYEARMGALLSGRSFDCVSVNLTYPNGFNQADNGYKFQTKGH